jgi:hypothetical protein
LPRNADGKERNSKIGRMSIKRKNGRGKNKDKEGISK